MKEQRYLIIINKSEKLTIVDSYDEYSEAINDYDFYCETNCRENYEIQLSEYNDDKKEYEVLYRAIFYAREKKNEKDII